MNITLNFKRLYHIYEGYEFFYGIYCIKLLQYYILHSNNLNKQFQSMLLRQLGSKTFIRKNAPTND